MPDPGIALLTTTFRATEPHRMKRFRQAVSCHSCRKRKSKCDRQHPCGTCEMRNQGDRCRYDSPSDKATARSRQEMQLKLSRLEQIVRGLAEQGPSALENHGEHRGKDAEAVVGEPQLGNRMEPGYHGATSWTALMESIHDIQDILAVEEEPEMADELDMVTVMSDVVLERAPPITIEDVIDSLPPRQDSDRLISAYFNAKFLAVPFIHTHHFKRRYDAFWDDPPSTSFLWISILFSILGVGAMVAKTKSSHHLSPSLSRADSRIYMAQSARCLVAGQYLRRKPFSIEALLMHAHSRNVQKQDSDSTLLALFGLTVRLAQQKGYHRDSTKISGKITAFDAEMRRRVWFMIQSADLLFSFQNGMPSVITEDSCDVDHPTNLTDDDFDEDSVCLPSPRSVNDPIPILVCILKSKLCRIMRRILHQAVSVTPTPYSEILSRNHELEEWHTAVPPCLRIRSIRNTGFTDPNYTIMHRLMLELLYRKCLCILHRPYLTVDKDNATYNASRQICRESALKILEMQAELDQETNPGKRMYEDRFMVSSLTLHHFLLAAMIACLDLKESTDISMEDRARRISMLRTACHIWSSRSGHSSDALHASQVLRAVLIRVESASGSSDTSASVLDTPRTGTNAQSNDRPMEGFLDMPGSSSAVDVPTSNSGSAVPGIKCSIDFNEAPASENLFSNTDVLHWYSIDQYLHCDLPMEGSLE